MITIDNIKSWAKLHSTTLGGKQTLIFDENLAVSIVGGRQGLYGDFEDDFELAVIDQKSKDFVTRFFVDEINDDVLPYASKEKVEEIVNKIFSRNDFQVK